MCGSGAPEIEWSAADWAGGSSGSIEKKFVIQDSRDEDYVAAQDPGSSFSYYTSLDDAQLFDTVGDADVAIRLRKVNGYGDDIGRFVSVSTQIGTTTKTTTTTTRRKS